MIDQEEIHDQCLSDSTEEHINALEKLKLTFSLLPDKHEAWDDLCNLTIDPDNAVRRKATSIVGFSFPHLPDKQKAWNELIRLINDKNKYVRFEAAESLNYAFSFMPNKQHIWEDIHILTDDQDGVIRYGVASTLASAYLYVPNKQQVWDDIHKLITDHFVLVRSEAAFALYSTFFNIPNRQQAYDDLHKLVNDQNSTIRLGAASILGSSFSHFPKKEQVWRDLHRLTYDEDIDIRSSAAEALGSAFPHMLDRQQAWNDLHRLTYDEDMWVKVFANHSLGRVSIFTASQAENEEDYKKELEKAIKFFEIAAKESSERMFNPSEFCLPFYRSFYTIIFRNQEAKEEVNKYLSEAKAAGRGSKKKELLFEAVENLANALKEVQNLENVGLQVMKGELNFYRKYCGRAAELMRDSEETTPFATIVLQKGLPILDRNLRELIEEIRKKAKTAYKESEGTDAEEIAYEINREVQKREIIDAEELKQFLEDMAYSLKRKIIDIPDNEYLLNKIESMRNEKSNGKKLRTLSFIIENLPTIKVVPVDVVSKTIENSERRILEEIRNISNRLDDVIISLEPGLREDLILHIGAISSVGGVEYTLTVPLHGLSYPEIKEDLRAISGKRISQLAMLPKKIARIVKEYLVENKMEDLLSKLS